MSGKLCDRFFKDRWSPQKMVYTPKNSLSNFDALAFELKHDFDFQSSQQPAYEISSYYNFSDGVTVFEIIANAVNIGEFHRDPWSDYWVAISCTDGCSVEFATKEGAEKYIKRLYVSTYC